MCALVLATVVADWIPEKGRRDGVKGLPFGRRSPVATASTGTLIFDLGRSPHSVHVYSIPSPASVSSSRSGPPWSSGRSPLLRVIMDSSPAAPHYSPLFSVSHRGQNANTGGEREDEASAGLICFRLLTKYTNRRDDPALFSTPVFRPRFFISERHGQGMSARRT